MSKNNKLYKTYKKFIREFEQDLDKEFRLRRDYTNYLYTVVSIDKNTADKYYAENDRVAKPFVKEYIAKVDSFFRKYNMSELVALRNVERINDYNYKVEFSFSLFDSKKRANRQVLASVILLISSIVSYFLFF